MTMSAYFQPSPTSWADLDASSSFGAAQTAPQSSTTVFPSAIYGQAAKDPYAAAKELGIVLPQPPAGGAFDADQLAGWYAICYIDIIEARLSRTYAAILRTYQKTGSFMCKYLLEYNNLAYRLIRAQQAGLDILRASGWTMFPADAPIPPMFTNLSSCSSLDSIAKARSPANPDGVGLSMGCVDLQTTSGFQAVGVTLGVAAIFAVAGIAATWLYAREFARQKPAVAKEITEQAAVEAEWLQKRAELVDQAVDKCVAKGGNPIDCLEAADAAVPSDLRSLDADWVDKLFPESRGWIWTIGAVVVASAAVGGIWWFFRRRNQRQFVIAPPRRQIIDAEYRE